MNNKVTENQNIENAVVFVLKYTGMNSTNIVTGYLGIYSTLPRARRVMAGIVSDLTEKGFVLTMTDENGHILMNESKEERRLYIEQDKIQ